MTEGKKKPNFHNRSVNDLRTNKITGFCLKDRTIRMTVEKSPALSGRVDIICLPQVVDTAVMKIKSFQNLKISEFYIEFTLIQ